ncbi:ABC transporter substrate-binding protein [Sulfurospirillum deleyianum]|uniref:Extracellular ligand-binding receptor n=1 Tax=Sulfurospirillum deleyianum (strain ATCC 51133 / DSM 6946 / 5175) TaxID=525898 RepID=D1B337_SULD5|nr:ABC transporter substrate-binding protein [Sulfurospirillum deleyianum]ACZ12507.1 Extracellular ligand-binding receptor [Sulfurospirillum deleyianum DSM 6946]
MRHFLAVATIASCVVSASLAKEISLGVVLPMSGSLAAYGQISYEGVEFAHSLNPTLKNGDTIKLVLVDSKGDKIESATATTRLITSEKVVGIIGEITSSNTAQVLSIADKKQIPIIATVATNDKLNDNRKYGNRVCYTDSFQGTIVAHYAAKELKYKTAVSIVDQAQVYSIGLAKAFHDAFVAQGGNVIKELKVSSGDKDFKAVVSQIKSLNPDFVFMPLYHGEGSLITRQAKQIGLNKPFLSGESVANPTFIELGGESVEGHMYVDYFDSSVPPTENSKAFLAAYEKKTGKKGINSFSTLGADAYNLFVDAMNRCANPEDSVCINQEIKKTAKFEGVSGLISMDAKGNATRSAVIKEIRGGKAIYKSTVNP